MSVLSNHTKLMNIILCLANRNRDCEPVLFNNHYIVETIELNFNKQNGEKINADLSLINPEVNNLLILECKDGGLELDQANRYSTLTQTDIINAGVTTLSGNFNYEVGYVGTENKKVKLTGDVVTNSFIFPVLICNENKIKLEHNSFNCPVLQAIFSQTDGVNIPNPAPVMYYPFGNDDSDAYILSRIGPVLIQLRGQEFDVETVLKNTHQLFGYIDLPSLKSLKGRVGAILHNVSKNELNEFFDLPARDKFKLKNFPETKFQRKLHECIAKADKTTSHKQSDLAKFEDVI